MTTQGGFATLSLPMVEKRRRRKEKPEPAEQEPPYREFGRMLDKWMKDGDLKNAEVGKDVGYKTGEVIRRCRKGQAMPRKDKLKKLADLMGMTPAELQYPGESKERALAGMLGEDAVELTPDEQQLIKAYRRMGETARKALRAHAVRLLEQHGVKGPDNPFSKAHQ